MSFPLHLWVREQVLVLIIGEYPALLKSVGGVLESDTSGQFIFLFLDFSVQYHVDMNIRGV